MHESDNTLYGLIYCGCSPPLFSPYSSTAYYLFVPPFLLRGYSFWHFSDPAPPGCLVIVSRAQISAPPGFSGHSRAPPPGFTERMEPTFNVMSG